MNIEELSRGQKDTRKRILEISFQKQSSHLGSCLSAVDLIDAVYQVKQKDEKFVLSNGHSAIALYVILEKYNLLKSDLIHNLHIHPDRNPAIGIDVSTGSLGQGLPIALGIALANRSKNVYCTISDGECSEGSIWETFRIAEEQKARNLKVILNANGWSAYQSIAIQKLNNRINSFDWIVIEADGHNINELVQALKIKTLCKPLLISAKTEVEQFPFLKGLNAHYKVMNKSEYEQAMEILK